MIVPMLAPFDQNPFAVARRSPVNVVVAYDGIAAAQNALDAIDSMKRRDPPASLIVHVSTWWFHLLDKPGPLSSATAAAIEADVLVISASIHARLPKSVKAWLQESLAKNRRSDVSVVALLGEEHRDSMPDSPRFQILQRIARASGARLCLPQG